MSPLCEKRKHPSLKKLRRGISHRVGAAYGRMAHKQPRARASIVAISLLPTVLYSEPGTMVLRDTSACLSKAGIMALFLVAAEKCNRARAHMCYANISGPSSPGIIGVRATPTFPLADRGIEREKPEERS